MSSTEKCKSCGSSDIEVDPVRGDTVCTNCGCVLESSIIISEVQFEEGPNGASHAIGQFVSDDTQRASMRYGSHFMGTGVESKELTMRKARNGITALCYQLQLGQSAIDTGCRFFEMALNRGLTKGRRNSHVYAACVYLTCRTIPTDHLLIDISDVLQICCYELGRTYLRLSQALYINIPAVDPCLYIMRFAKQLEFGPKTQEVANTAQRLVQRMKRDSIHSGRRPSGLCGAALLIAARLHEFGRSTSDIVKIVKVHESTLRKRLIEFGDTPTSALTLEEFESVDLNEEQDPPSFKAARKKDKERLQKLMEEEAESITELQQEIEMQLNKDAKLKCRKRGRKISEKDEIQETNRFIQESTVGTINEIINEGNIGQEKPAEIKGLGPDFAIARLATSMEDTSNAVQPTIPEEVDLTFDDIDDEELDSYIMSEYESKNKNDIWLQRNAAFLEEQRIKAEKLQKEREEGKPEKKKRRQTRRKPMAPTKSASEAVEKVIREKKISSKINYEVLKSLNENISSSKPPPGTTDRPDTAKSNKRPLLQSPEKDKSVDKPGTGEGTTDIELPLVEEEKKNEQASEEEVEEDFEEEPVEETTKEQDILDVVRQHRELNDEDYEGDGYGGYDEEY